MNTMTVGEVVNTVKERLQMEDESKIESVKTSLLAALAKFGVDRAEFTVNSGGYKALVIDGWITVHYSFEYTSARRAHKTSVPHWMPEVETENETPATRGNFVMALNFSGAKLKFKESKKFGINFDSAALAILHYTLHEASREAHWEGVRRAEAIERARWAAPVLAFQSKRNLLTLSVGGSGTAGRYITLEKYLATPEELEQLLNVLAFAGIIHETEKGSE